MPSASVPGLLPITEAGSRAERAVGRSPGKEGDGMIRAGSELDGEVLALLATEREIPVLPAAVRERMLARAREALSKRMAPPLVYARTPQGGRWAAAAGAVLVVGSAGGTAAYHLCARPQMASSVSLVVPTMPAPAADLRHYREDRFRAARREAAPRRLVSFGWRGGRGGAAASRTRACCDRTGELRCGTLAHLRARAAFQEWPVGRGTGGSARERAVGARPARRGSARCRDVRGTVPVEPAAVDRQSDGELVLTADLREWWLT